MGRPKKKLYEDQLKEKYNGKIENLEPYVNLNTKILHRCNLHKHNFCSTPASVLGSKHGCPLCGEEALKEHTDSLRVFDDEDYAREFSETYYTKVTRDGSNSDLAVNLLVNLTSDQVNELIDKIYNKLPKFVQKFVGREKINEVIVEFIQYLKDNEDVQNKVDEYINYMAEKTKISKNIIKVVVEFSFKYAEELFDTDNIKPTV